MCIRDSGSDELSLCLTRLLGRVLGGTQRRFGRPVRRRLLLQFGVRGGQRAQRLREPLP